MGSLSLEKVGNKNIVSGSGTFNCADLVKAKIIPEQKKVDEATKKLEFNDKVVEALAEYMMLLDQFKMSSDSLRSPEQKGDSQVDVFAIRETFLDINNPTYLPQSYVTAKAQAGAAVGSYTISVINIATQSVKLSNSFTSDSINVVTGAVGFFSPGDLYINGVDIQIVAGDNLNNIAFKINSVNLDTGVSAAVIRISSTNFQIKISSDKPGIANSFVISDPSLTLGQITWTNSPAVDANFRFDDVLMSRSDNEINDVINGGGLLISLSNATPVGVVITISITASEKEIFAAIQDYIAKFNEITMFEYKQKEMDTVKGKPKETAILANNIDFKMSEDRIVGIQSSIVQGIANMNSFFQLGLKSTVWKGNKVDPPSNNILAYVDGTGEKVRANIKSNLEEVRQLFQFSAIINSDKITIVKRSSFSTATSFTIDINTARPNKIVGSNSIQDKVRVIIDGVTYIPNYDSNYNVITGIPNTPLDGIVMVYSGSGVDLITVSITRGLAELTYQEIQNSIAGRDNMDSRYLLDSTNNVASYDANGNVKLKMITFKGSIRSSIESALQQNEDYEKAIEKANSDMESKQEKYLRECSVNDAKQQKLQQKINELKTRTEMATKKD